MARGTGHGRVHTRSRSSQATTSARRPSKSASLSLHGERSGRPACILSRAMHTQPTSSKPPSDSLDRTDVLPVLDVEAYEQTLVENQKGLSRTDTWTVEALRDIDELVESATHEAAPIEVRSINV